MSATDAVVPPARHRAGSVTSPRLGHLLKHAYLEYLELATAALEPLGIAPQEWAALHHFTDQRPRSQVEAARVLGVDRTTMVALVDELEGKGLVKRRPHDEDRRKNVIELTTAGQKLKKSAAARIDECERSYLRMLGESEADHFKDVLATLISKADHEPAG